ncbi:helix-turn-helix domain-containing protein, partial [Nonomuraea dietziae]|uniref:helix-turn-helix domain-containing protein n=1 Tax=Nonomuraea dietziae TaxID=65515 RepID=UPI0031D4BDDC
MVPPEDSQLLDTATRLFAAMGYDGTPIEQIAEAAGVGVADLRRAFGGKRELYLAVMERCHQTERGPHWTRTWPRSPAPTPRPSRAPFTFSSTATSTSRL